jgi:hypothetical protein
MTPMLTQVQFEFFLYIYYSGSLYSQTNISTADQKYAGINHSEMDQNSPIILDKENIQPNAHGKHSHVGIGTATTTCSALSVASGKDQITSCLFQRVTLFYNLYCNNIMTGLTNETLQIFLTLRWTEGTRNNGKEELR